MPTRRMIEPAIWQSESMGRLTIRQRLMFIGMFSNADDQGRLRASAPVIRSAVFPYDDISLAEVESDILAISNERCILLYDVNGSRFEQIVNWWKYQKHQWAYPSGIPKPDGWIDRLRYRKSGKVITENWDDFTQEPSIDQNRIEVGKGLGKSLGKDESKKPPKEKQNGAEKAQRQPDPLFDAIAEVCGVDPATAGSSIAKVESALKKSTPPYTPEEVKAFGVKWWEWKERTDPPTIWKLKEQIGTVRNGNGSKNGNATARIKEPEYTQAELARAARINAERKARREAEAGNV